MERYKPNKDENGDIVKWSDVEKLLSKYNDLVERCEDAEMMISCLQAGGVDNWEGHENSIEEYYEWKNRA